MNLARLSLVLSFASGLFLSSCGGDKGSAANAAALCAKSCDKLSTLCFADAGAFGGLSKTTCMSSCTSNTTSMGTTTCSNPNATIAAYQACVDRVDMTCEDFEACLATVPPCEDKGTGGSSGGGTGGSSGGTGGSSGGGTGGSSGGTGGTSGGTGGFTGFDGSIPGFDGSIPGFDAGLSGTCADLLICCNAMANAQSKTSCMTAYSTYMALGDSFCAAVVTAYKASGACP